MLRLKDLRPTSSHRTTEAVFNRPFWFLMEWFFSWPQRREEGPSGRRNQGVDEGARDLLWPVQRNTQIYKSRPPLPMISRESLQKYFSVHKSYTYSGLSRTQYSQYRKQQNSLFFKNTELENINRTFWGPENPEK